MNIIFLDIDGVLNGYNYLNYVKFKLVKLLHLQKWADKHSRDPFGIHKEKVKKLAKIVRKTNAKVVMSSSWRHAFWKTPYKDKKGNLKILADELNSYGIEVIDITPKLSSGRRDEEIQEWLTKNKEIVDNFVILDDERFDLECFVNSNLVLTSSLKKGEMIKGNWKENTGLKNKHVRKAIKILKNQKLTKSII